MFEIIGVLVVIYLALGFFVLSVLFAYNVQGMRTTLNIPIKDRKWGELAFILLFSLWCWPWPLFEFLSDR